jgi:hypothetical protein
MNRLRLASSMVGAGMLGVSCWLLATAAPGGAAEAKSPTLPDADYARTIEPSVKLLQDALAGEVTRRSADKARLSMLMLAEFAQQNLSGPDGLQRATVRDAALEIAVLVKNKQYAEAVLRAKALPKLPASKEAKTAKVKLLGPQLDVEELMGQFRSAEKGGLGIEDLLDKLAGSADGQLPAAALNEELRLVAYRTAVAGEVCGEHLPPLKGPLWRKLSEEMSRQAGKLAESVQAKDGKAAFQAVAKLHASCKDCHREFR